MITINEMPPAPLAPAPKDRLMGRIVLGVVVLLAVAIGISAVFIVSSENSKAEASNHLTAVTAVTDEYSLLQSYVTDGIRPNSENIPADQHTITDYTNLGYYSSAQLAAISKMNDAEGLLFTNSAGDPTGNPVNPYSWAQYLAAYRDFLAAS